MPAVVWTCRLGSGTVSMIDAGPLRSTVVASDNTHVTGVGFSSDFPTTPGVYQTTCGGSGDVFVTKITFK